MKRSEINKALKELEAMLADYRYYLPKFADFTPEEWKTKGHEFDEITVWAILIRSVFPCLRSATEI